MGSRLRRRAASMMSRVPSTLVARMRAASRVSREKMEAAWTTASQPSRSRSIVEGSVTSPMTISVGGFDAEGVEGGVDGCGVASYQVRLLAGCDERGNGVAADEAGAAGDCDLHGFRLPRVSGGRV